MNELQFFGVASGLGIGGFDPVPALIAAVYIAARGNSGQSAARKARRDVLLFGAVLILGTAAWGFALSRLLGEHLADIPWHSLLRAGGWAAGIEILVAIVGLCFAGYRWIHRNDPPEEKEQQDRSLAGLLSVALGFVAIVTADLPFVVTIGLSSHQPAWAVLPAFLAWAVISQGPLFVMCVAVLFNQHHRASKWIGRAWSAARPWIRTAIPVAIAVICVLLLLDAGRYFVMGRFLVG
ncbi:hypothetical protein [Kocuria sp. HSID16901]|uniref:hypothetical protein n=1 Tax=Kocuria sp. HSID16901 TaxID=2419505 RepID=UPI000660C61B|nr:hypothetical protein [Kocuria sp. HSID16901]RUQ21752.1 hypothetical protein D8M21_05505 [Kocuria sp. HSID16901]